MTVRVLLVDDSAFVRDVLRHGLSRFPDIDIVGEAPDGKRAEDAVMELLPDVVTMDVLMPMVSGLDAIRNIMARRPTPIIVVSEAYGDRIQLSLDAMRAGAIDVFPKPVDGFDERAQEQLAGLLRAAARTRNLRRASTSPPVQPITRPHPVVRTRERCDFIGVVASTGGPQTLHRMLAHLHPTQVPPIAIVQHISDGVDGMFASWLDKAVKLKIRLARDRMVVPAGTAVVAPNGLHLEILPGGITRLQTQPASSPHRPSGDVLLRSLARSIGRHAAGVILTGMGDDGAAGAGELEASGGTIYVEDPRTAIIDGMPLSAIDNTHTPHVARVQQLALMLRRHPENP